MVRSVSLVTDKENDKGRFSKERLRIWSFAATPDRRWEDDSLKFGGEGSVPSNVVRYAVPHNSHAPLLENISFCMCSFLAFFVYLFICF